MAKFRQPNYDIPHVNRQAVEWRKSWNIRSMCRGSAIPHCVPVFQIFPDQALEDGTAELDGIARTALLAGWHHIQALDERIAWCDSQIAARVKHDTNAQRLMAIVGIGPLTASAAVATVGGVAAFITAAGSALH